MTELDEIRQRTDIVDIIGETVALQRAGRNFKALCPFHPEKTPSFIVFPDRQRWHCFGACATGGDVFTFVMRRHNLDFAGALRFLAERAGVSLRRASGRGERAQKERLRQANEAAAVFFQNALFNSSPGALALDYMTMRGIDRETAEAFQLGYSPDSWDALREYLRARGFNEVELLRAGLLVEGDAGLYDRFRDRLMFPIRDEQGRVLGFGSRRLKEAENESDESPKYLNTPQTPIFDKGSILYGLDKAREHIRRAGQVIVVEGYMDVIAAHQHDNRNVVASMGTALTERQVAFLRQLTENFVLAFDPDVAGQAASERGTLIAYEKGANIRVINLPEGKDPDQIIRSSPDTWRQLVKEAIPYHPARPPVGSLGERRASVARHRPETAADAGRSEELCLALLLRFPELREKGLGIDEALFSLTENRQLFQYWVEVPEQETLGEKLPEVLYERFERIAGKSLDAYAKSPEAALDSCIRHLTNRTLELELEANTVAISEKERKLGLNRAIKSAYTSLNEGSQGDTLSPEEAELNYLILRNQEISRKLHAGRRGKRETQ
ncbi:MAG: DNA primase [Dehalococcoidia bacterium]|nr:DNA primase [Dehalococcoidia bacterium]